MSNETVSLTISKEIVNPIVDAKIKDAIIAAMGGQDKLIEKVVDQVLNTKVDKNGDSSRYASENTHNWLDVVVTKQIKAAVEEQLKSVVADCSTQIREELIKQLQSKKGASKIAEALMACLVGTFANNWTSQFQVSFGKKEY